MASKNLSAGPHKNQSHSAKVAPFFAEGDHTNDKSLGLNVNSKMSAFMDIDIHLFDIKREQYRKSRLFVIISVPFILVYSVLIVVAEQTCILQAQTDSKDPSLDPCVINGPMSCFSSICSDAGLVCFVNRECMCPNFEESCNLTAFTVNDDCDGNHSFDYHYSQCSFSQGLTLCNTIFQSITLVTCLTFSILYWHQIRRQSSMTSTQTSTKFFRGTQRGIASLTALVGVSKFASFGNVLYYTQYDVIWQLWDDHDADIWQGETDDTTESFNAIINNLIHPFVSVSSFAGPIIVYLSILRALPSASKTFKCHLALLLLNAICYVAIRITLALLYGQTFGYVPFAYVASVIQVCFQEPPTSIQAEMEAASLQPEWIDEEVITSTTEFTTDEYDWRPESGPLDVLQCDEVPPMLWAGLAAVLIWDIFLFAQALIIRSLIEENVRTVVYTYYRAIILYYRFVDALVRLLWQVGLLIGVAMALANKELFRWELWSPNEITLDDEDYIDINEGVQQIVPLKLLGVTNFGGSPIDTFFSLWIFGLIYLHLPRLYNGYFLQAFCPPHFVQQTSQKNHNIEGDQRAEHVDGDGASTQTALHTNTLDKKSPAKAGLHIDNDDTRQIDGTRIRREQVVCCNKDPSEYSHLPGDFDCFIDMVYADFVKEIVSIHLKLQHNNDSRDYYNNTAFQNELLNCLGEENYARFHADHKTLQVIGNKQGKNHCWILESKAQNAIVIAFPGEYGVSVLRYEMDSMILLDFQHMMWRSVLFGAGCSIGTSNINNVFEAFRSHTVPWQARAIQKQHDESKTEIARIRRNSWRFVLRAPEWKKSGPNNTILDEIPYAPANCRVHAGFFSMYNTLRDDVILAVMHHIRQYPVSTKITVTGHSLGAVLSTFLAIDLIENGLVRDLQRLHVSLYGCPRMGNLAFKRYYDSIVPQTLHYGVWNDPILNFPPQPCRLEYWQCVGKNVVLLPGHQLLVEPSELEVYFLQLALADRKAHRRFTYYHAILALLLDPTIANAIKNVPASLLSRYFWSMHLVILRSPPEIKEFYATHLPEYAGNIMPMQQQNTLQGQVSFQPMITQQM